MNASEFWIVVERIRASDSRYTRDAYAFVMDGLDCTVRALGERRHVSAGELLEGLFRFARGRYGMMSYDVLRAWGIVSGSGGLIQRSAVRSSADCAVGPISTTRSTLTQSVSLP